MGSSHYSDDDYKARTSTRATYASTMGIPVVDATFMHTAGIKSGTVDAKVHATLEPLGVKLRESRDSDAHPVTIPIAVLFDTTGSMGEVPVILQKELSKLMGAFLNDKSSGKKYLGDAYPAIMVGGFDDYDAMQGSFSNPNGTLQVGQFESGIEIDDNLTNMWITGHGGGTYEESYETALYFVARHTVHDHWEKRRRKGYLFLIGDEHPYPHVSREQVKKVIGDTLQADIPLKDIVKEVQERYHVFYILPNLTHHYNDDKLHKFWMDLLGQQNAIKLADPSKICECIAAAVAISEEHVGVDDLEADGLLDSKIKSALVPLAKSREVSKYSAEGLPPVKGDVGGVERL